MSNLPCLVSRWRSCEDSKESPFPSSPNLLSTFILRVSAADAFLSMNTNYAPGWGFKITYPLFKDVSLNYWLRLLEKGQCFTSEKVYLYSLRQAEPWEPEPWEPLGTSDLPWAFQQLGLCPCRANMKEEAKAPHLITEKKRKKNPLKVMPFPLVDSGRGGIYNHSFRGINIHLSLLQLPWCLCLWHWDHQTGPLSTLLKAQCREGWWITLLHKILCLCQDQFLITWRMLMELSQFTQVKMNNLII